MPHFTLRAATAEELARVGELLAEYMGELFERPWGGTAERLRRDVLAGELSVQVALVNGALEGFACWRWTYDVHHCVKGAELMDLFVRRPHRGRGLGPGLILAVMREVAAGEGVFLKGQGVSKTGDSLYERVAMQFPGTEFIVGGRAFRELVGLMGKPWREVLRALPSRSANLEP